MGRKPLTFKHTQGDTGASLPSNTATRSVVAQHLGTARLVGWDTCPSQSPQVTVAILFQKGAGKRVELPPARAQPPPAGDWGASAEHPSRMASGPGISKCKEKACPRWVRQGGRSCWSKWTLQGRRSLTPFRGVL